MTVAGILRSRLLKMATDMKIEMCFKHKIEISDAVLS